MGGYQKHTAVLATGLIVEVFREYHTHRPLGLSFRVVWSGLWLEWRVETPLHSHRADDGAPPGPALALAYASAQASYRANVMDIECDSDIVNKHRYPNTQEVAHAHITFSRLTLVSIDLRTHPAMGLSRRVYTSSRH